MRILIMLLVLCGAVRAAEPLPQEMYDLRQPELTVARSLTDKMRTARRVVLGAPVRPRVNRPTAVLATHVGSDAAPIRPAFTLVRHGLAHRVVGECGRCGAKVSESYAVLCDECRGR